MATYTELVDSQLPLCILSSNGAALSDVSSNALTVTPGTTPYDYSVVPFKDTSVGHSINKNTTAGTGDTVDVTFTSNLVTTSMWIKRDASSSGQIGILQLKASDVALFSVDTSGLIGINTGKS